MRRKNIIIYIIQYYNIYVEKKSYAGRKITSASGNWTPNTESINRHYIGYRITASNQNHKNHTNGSYKETIVVGECNKEGNHAKNGNEKGMYACGQNPIGNTKNQDHWMQQRKTQEKQWEQELGSFRWDFLFLLCRSLAMSFYIFHIVKSNK